MVWRVLKRGATPILLSIALVSGIHHSPALAAAPSHSPSGDRHGVLAGAGKVRLCTKTTKLGCHARGLWQHKAHVKVVCEKGGSSAVGRYRSNRWYYIENGGRRAFIHSSWVRREGDVPSCRDNPDALALQWAAKRVGEVDAKASERGLGINNGQWSGWCGVLTDAAYEIGAHQDPQFSDNARTRYFLYRGAGRMRPWNPWKAEIGAMVFWPNTSAFGHTAIYAGRGYVISTMGSTAFRRPVSIARVPTWGRPAGWVAPDDV